MKKEKLLKKILNNPRDVSFKDAVKCAEMFGFVMDRISGSHHIFIHSGIRELINLQNVKGMAKPYQVKQLLEIIEKNNLKIKE